MKIVTILGARPQFIKSSIVSKAINKNSKIEEVIIHTGQHFDDNMSSLFFNQLEMPKPKYNLNINNMSHAKMTGVMLEKIETILIKEQPQGVLVYGDTNSTLAGSLAAAKLNLPVFHVEAGLRSYNRLMPEEINRLLTDQISSLLFCPTENAVNILKKEGINKGVIHSGDVMYDLFISSNKNIVKNNDSFILATIHRPANTENPIVLESIIKGLEKINAEKKVVIPLHPRTKQKLKKFGITTNLKIIKPVGYLEMMNHLKNAQLVITDSGGLQKEAYFSKTKCITVRSETEWVELIDQGVNTLCDPTIESMWIAYNKMIIKKCDFSPYFYGDGRASAKIVKSIFSYLDHI